MKEYISKIVMLCSDSLMSDELIELPIQRERLEEILHMACKMGENMGLQAFYKYLRPHELVTSNTEYFNDKECEWMDAPETAIGYRVVSAFPIKTKVRLRLFEAHNQDLPREDTIIIDEDQL